MPVGSYGAWHNSRVELETTPFSTTTDADGGVVIRDDTVYATVQAGGGNFSAVFDSSNINLRRVLSGGTYTVSVGLIRWDTSALDGPAATAKLGFRVLDVINPGSYRVHADWYVWSGVEADWTNASPTTAWDGALLSSFANETDYEFDLKNVPANVNPDGYTYLRLTITDTATPTTNHRFRLHGFGNPPGPKITVESQIDTGNAPIVLSGPATEESTGSLTPIPGTASRALAGASTEETMGVLAAAPGTAVRALTGVASEESTGAVAAEPGTATIAIVGYWGGLVPGDYPPGDYPPYVDEMTGVLIATREDVPGSGSVSLAGAATEEQVGTLSATPGAVATALPSLSTEEAAGSLAATPGIAGVVLSGSDTEESAGALAATPGAVTVTLSGVGSEEVAGSLSVSGAGTVSLAGVGTEEAAGTLSATPGTVLMALPSLTTEETTGALGTTAGGVFVPLAGAETDELAGSLTASLLGEYAGRYVVAWSVAPKPQAALSLAAKPVALVGVADKPNADVTGLLVTV